MYIGYKETFYFMQKKKIGILGRNERKFTYSQKVRFVEEQRGTWLYGSTIKLIPWLEERRT